MGCTPSRIATEYPGLTSAQQNLLIAFYNVDPKKVEKLIRKHPDALTGAHLGYPPVIYFFLVVIGKSFHATLPVEAIERISNLVGHHPMIDLEAECYPSTRTVYIDHAGPTLHRPDKMEAVLRHDFPDGESLRVQLTRLTELVQRSAERIPQTYAVHPVTVAILDFFQAVEWRDAPPLEAAMMDDTELIEAIERSKLDTGTSTKPAEFRPTPPMFAPTAAPATAGVAARAIAVPPPSVGPTGQPVHGWVPSNGPAGFAVPVAPPMNAPSYVPPPYTGYGSTLTNDRPTNDLKCLGCGVHPREVLFLPCKHLCYCRSCEARLSELKCALCPKPIERRVSAIFC